MRGGNNAKPTKLKLLEGNPGKRALPKNEPSPKLGRPSKPKCLTGEAAAEWKRVVPELESSGLLAKIDRPALTGYCISWAAVVRAHEKEQSDTLNLALTQLRQWCVMFGISPAARTRIQVKPTAPEESASDKARRTAADRSA